MDITSYLLGKQAGGGDTPTGTIDITENGVVDVTSYASADVDVQPDLESKSVTISTNTVTTIRPTEGKDGLSSVEVTTNVPQPSGKIEITQNGTDIDVSSYATADVNVSGGGKFVFAGNKGGLSFQSVGLTQNEAQTVITDIIDKIDTSSISRMNSMFSSNPLMTNLDFTGFNISNALALSNMFYNCSGLTSLNLSTFKNEANNGDVNCSYMFYSCSSLQHLDMRSFEWDKLTSTTTTFNSVFGDGGGGSAYMVPSSCEIIVKDNTQKQWFTSKFSRFTNVKTVAEYEGG